MKKSGSEVGRIDHQLILQIQTEINYLKEVLTRVAAVVKSLSSRGLAMRGHEDKIGSTHSGNFGMSLELIAEFDLFLKNHISTFGIKGKRTTSYLSFTVFEQFIKIMGEKVKKTIVNEIKNAKHFSIIVDSTADISHTDQLAFIFRYATINGEPVERFLQFLANPGHKSKDLADTVFMVLGENEIDFNNCRGQSYDNASNMSGIYSGLQARIKEACPHAVYIPCAAHSLNLVGECAANCCINANDFINFLQNIYSFFSASTYRWDMLDQSLSKPDNETVKRLSDTRWAARYEACLSLSRNWNDILKASNIFINNPTENSKTKCECNGLLKKIKSLEIGIVVSVWNDILERFNIVNLDTSFMNECIHFLGYLKGLPESVSTKSVLYLCQVMKDDNLLDIYPYVNIALRMFLCVPASNTSAERSFSTLKRVKTYLRSLMNDNRLNSLAILNIESQFTTSLNYDEIIEDFARSKARRKILI
ncbi:hypothetical protein QTP88_019669 [Uroleucon formosanum]